MFYFVLIISCFFYYLVVFISFYFSFNKKEKFEDIKGIFRSRNSKKHRQEKGKKTIRLHRKLKNYYSYPTKTKRVWTQVLFIIKNKEK